ncbi:MAG TPA: hypothetical protein DEG06_04790 [Lachnospiraceae bacterium]|jgi:nucleoside-diphosphate-sugar epimerase|nr:hypothetical protein [Lachnospiraceae bacterium]
MKLRENPLYRKDLEKALKAVLDLDKLAGKTILITGATGLICSSIVDLLLFCNEIRKTKITIYIAARSERNAYQRFAENENLHYLHYDANESIKFNVQVDYIIHGASNAYPELIINYPVETMNANFYGLMNLLNYAKAHGVKRLLYISSSEIYGKKGNAHSFQENEYGFIDLLNPRSSYALAKRASETLCISYLSEYNVDSVIARPGHIYGPTASPNDNRVSSSFAYTAARGKDIVLKSTGMQLRSYCYCLDCATAILTVLTRGKTGNAYNISNNKSKITIYQMAKFISRSANVKLLHEKPNEKEKIAYNPMENSSLDSGKLEALGWEGFFTADTGFQHTISILKQIDI